ncbi:MAG: T9SS type A sorting domain-containing protein [Raineya sp.]|jgi:hypothetical protein|nr:T9SS type A sorting domain-containing protein [Raineya sp.]
MRNFTLTLILIFLTQIIQGQTITVGTVTPNNLCGGDNVSVTFTVSSSFNAGNFFTVQLSDALGSFASPTAIGTLISVTSGTIGATIPIATPNGTNYRIRIIASDPAITSSNTSGALSISNVVGNPAIFGNGQWNVYAYTGNIVTNTSLVYKGTYTEPAFNFDSRNRWSDGSTPSAASGYTGCPVTVDNHSVSYKRTNFTCGYYRFDVVGLVNANGHDDAYQLLVDGVVVASNGGCCAPRPDVYRGILGPASTVEFRWAEGGGASYGALQITQLSDFDMVTQPIPSICASSSINLSVVSNINNANYSYLWTAPNGATGTTATFTTPVGLAGTYTLQVTHTPTGCVQTTNVPVNFSAVPTVTITPNTATICPGEQVTLTASGANTYTWSPATGLSATTGATVIASPTTTTTYTITGSNGCTTSTTNITVNVTTPAPDPGTFGNGSWFVACYRGNNFNTYFGNYTEPLLTFDSRNRWGTGASPSNASGYTGGCVVPDDQHSVIYRRTNFTCGYYQIDITNHDDYSYLYINGTLVSQKLFCCTSQNNVWRGFLGPTSTVEFRWREFGGGSHGGLRFTEISASQSPVTSPTAVTICQGSSTNITTTGLPTFAYSSTFGTTFDTFGANANITWTQVTGNVGDFTITPTGLNATVTANVTPTPNPATIRYTATDPTTGCSISRDVQITVDPLPSTAASASVTTICVGESSILTATGANTYQWYDQAIGGSLIGTGATVTVSPTTTTTYRLEGNNNCATVNATITITVVPKGAPPLTGTEFGNGEWIAHCYNGRLISTPTTVEYRGYYREKSLTFDSRTRWNQGNNPTLAVTLVDGSEGYSGCTVNNDNHSISWRRTNFTCGLYTIGVFVDDSYRLLINGVQVATGGCCGFVPNVWSGLLDATSTVELITQDTGGASYGGLSIGFSLGSPSTAIWTGAVNTNWFNPGNWCPTSPSDVTDVIIPGGGVVNFPVINATGAEARNIQIAVGATLTINTGFSLEVHGNYIQEGALVANTNSSVQIVHNATPVNTQIQVTGTGAFHNLNIDKTGNTVNLLTGIQVNNQLTLNNGELNLNSNTLTINNSALTAIVRNNNAFIRSETNSATNNSRICWNMGTTTGAFLFPFGVSSSEYIPVTFNKQTNTNANICISTRATLTADNTPWATGVTNVAGVSGATAINDVVDRWWDITSTVNPLPAPGANVTFNYRGSENTLANPRTDNLAVQHWNGTSWDAPYTASSAGVISGVGSVTAQNIRDFSPFVISREIRPLPVQLLNFSAQAKNSVVLLSWIIAQNVNNEFYTVERSGNGVQFEKIGTIKSENRDNYQWTDKKPLEGISYYRLKRQDDKGNIEYSQIEAVNFLTTIKEGLSIIPNPSNGENVLVILQTQVKEKGIINITDALGRNILQEMIDTDNNGRGDKQIRLGLAKGIYIVQVITETKLYQDKIVVK